jgi:hypothetical protein
MPGEKRKRSKIRRRIQESTESMPSFLAAKPGDRTSQQQWQINMAVQVKL